MAPQLSLVRLEDLAADVDSLDLLSGGFDLIDWQQAIANEEDASASEVLTLKISGSSQDNLASLLQSLDEKVKQANWRRDFSERYDVWLRAKLGNETSARQAMILKARRSASVPLFDAPAGRENIARSYQLGLERTPWWEDPYPYPSTTNLSGVNSIGGMATLSETINGDVNARLIRLTAKPNVGDLGKFWLGWKTNRFGNPANFISVWSVRLGQNGTDTSDTVDATAYDGNRITCTFATNSALVQRAIVHVSAVTLNEEDQRGTYAILMRAKMSDSSVARARIGHGYMLGSSLLNPTYNSRQVISGTLWNYYEMGDVSIPPSEVLSTFLLNNCAISVDAERVSGSGELHIDCFVLIPTDDASVQLVSASDLSAVYKLYVFQKPNDRIDALVEFTSIAGVVAFPVEIKPRNWSLPANGTSPRLVFAAQSLTEQDKADTADITYQYTSRWATLRGSET